MASGECGYCDWAMALWAQMLQSDTAARLSYGTAVFLNCGQIQAGDSGGALCISVPGKPQKIIMQVYRLEKTSACVR